MSNNVMICNHEIGIKMYEGQPVVTFKDIDTLHGRPDGTAKTAFSKHKDRFVEGKHFYRLTRKSLENAEKYTKDTFDFLINSPRGITVLTERGYLLLTKPFNDDLAWQIQEGLIEHYFNHREDPPRRKVKFCSGVPVVTFSDIDEFHKLDPGTARNYFASVRDQFILDEDYILGNAEEVNRAFGSHFPVDKPVAFLKQHTYELSMFRHIPLPQIKSMIPEYFELSAPDIIECRQYAQPSVTVEQPVAAIEQKPVENLTSELIIPNRGVRDRIDLTFSAYAATYNYYRSGKRIKTNNLHKVDGYGYLEGIGANILSHASHYGCAGYGPLTMRPDEDPHFCFPISSIRKDGKITIPKLGLFELKTPLWIEEGSRPVTATVRRTKDNKYMVEIRRKSN